ncbi:MAG: ribulokinase [Candidatus Methylacidiphilales bacterium]
MQYSLGIDYGTNSVRSVVVRCQDGKEIAAFTYDYPSGRQGVLLDPKDHHLARQHPGDYLIGLEKTVRGALKAAARTKGFHPHRIVGIGVDATGSSPIPVDKENRALASLPKWKKNLHAQCWLWKDHTSHREAAAITDLASQHRPHYIAQCGNTYSSEWFWSKIWKCLRTDRRVFNAAFSWVELADWIPSVMAGIQDPLNIRRGICMAGHKALYSDRWGGLPDKEFLTLLDPALADLRDRLYQCAYDAREPAGTLCPDWSKKLGLAVGIPIAIGQMDVHYGAIGCGITEGTLVKVIGTSTCDCGVVSNRKKIADIPGICGIVDGSILPGYYGIEAGQSAVGDIFKWWIEGICEGDTKLYARLAAEASALQPGQSGLLALDWNNGNRTILVDPMLSGLLVGTTLHTTRAEIYRALIEATAFGARTIIERMVEYGVPIRTIVCAGGIAEKNPLLMQIYADVTGRTLRVSSSSQTCALGAAVAAAVVAGVHPSFPAAQKAMTSLKPIRYQPRPAAQKIYNHLYSLYRQLHDSFGGAHSGANNSNLSRIMKELLEIKSQNVIPTRK